MITYRRFRNADPPALTRLWNACFEGRGVVRPLRTDQFESLVGAKLYFDPDGLILALDGAEVVGLVHAGFGADATQRALDLEMGVIAMLGVQPGSRGRGIGTELLHRGEDYLRRRGARVVYGGAMAPLNPFYLGLYGGSELPGVLDSDLLMHRLLLRHGYRPCAAAVVLQRAVPDGPAVVDRRFLALGRRLDLEIIDSPSLATWWAACQFSPFDLTRYELRAKQGGRAVAGLTVWDMTTFGQVCHQNIAGLIDVEVVPQWRRQGVGKFLLIRVLRHLRDLSVDRVEVQTMEHNLAARALYQGLGFVAANRGTVFRRDPVER